MSSIPDFQRAWTVVRRGKPADALVLEEAWPVSKELKEGEILVKVQAAALNPVGWKVMRVAPNIIAGRPHVAEHDFSGIVVDANGTRFNAGDEVYGWVPTDQQPKTKQGVLAQYSKVNADQVVIRPANITPTQAAGITLAALTAYQALFNTIKLDVDQTVFINGGSTAVGAFAIQFAKFKGAQVIATASAKNEEFVRKMGADEFIDYRKEPLVTFLSNNPPSTKYHAIFDAVGLIDPSLFTYSANYLAPGGIFATTGPLPRGLGIKDIWNIFRTIGAVTIPAWLGNVDRRWSVIFVKNNVEDLKKIQEMLGNGLLWPIVDSVYDFEDVFRAYDRILSTRAVGKIVVKVDPDAQ